MAKNRLIEKIIAKKEELKKVIGKRVVPLVLAGGIAVGSVFGFAGCKNNQQQVDNTNDANYEEVIGSQQEDINALKQLVGSLQEEVDDLKTEVDTKADLKAISEINKELVSITKTLADLTNNIATINNYYLSVKDKIDTTNTKVDKLETSLNEISKKYDEQQKVLNALVAQIEALETKVNELSNTNNETTNSDLQSQIAEMKQTINRLTLENAIQKTANSRYNYIYDTNNYTHTVLTSPNGDICGVIEDDEGYNYYLAEDNFVCTLNADGTNYINYGDVTNTTQQLYVLCQGGYLSMSFDDCNITREGNIFTISRTREGNIDTIYITLSEKGMLQYIQYDGEYLVIQGTDRELYYNSYNQCKIASEIYNNLQSVIDNSWTDDCLVYSPHAEEGDEYGVYFNNEEAYMYMNEAEYGKSYGVAEDGYMASITQTTGGELELYEQPPQNMMDSFKDMILNNGEGMLISYNAENDSYIIEGEETVKIEYFVENNEIVSIKVLDKATNVEKECVKIISQEEFEQKADEIKTKFDELKAEYDNSNILGQ